MKKINLVIFILMICLLISTNAYADNTTAWNGYSLYNLNNAAIESDSATQSCTIFGSRISSVAGYTVKNNSNSEITATLGIPVNDIDSISVTDNGKSVKLKTRSLTGIRDTYAIEGLLPQAETWYSFSIYLKSGESHTLQVKTEEILHKDNTDIYDLVFFSDRGNTHLLKAGSIQFKAAFSDYRPYNLVDVNGIQYGDISKDGNITINMKRDEASTFSIKYQPVEKMILDRLSQSKYKKPKAIARAFRAKDYATAITLCDEYISFPQDKQLNTDQVKFVKAESLRKQNKNSDYADIVSGINTSSIYPTRSKYKIQLDKLDFFKSAKKDTEYQQLLNQLDGDTKENYEFMNYWLKANGYILNADDKPAAEKSNISAVKPEKKTDKKGWFSAFTGNITKQVGKIRTDLVIAVIVSFILGFFFGRRSGHRRGRRSDTVYLFRN